VLAVLLLVQAAVASVSRPDRGGLEGAIVEGRGSPTAPGRGEDGGTNDGFFVKLAYQVRR
jgi:hypothetical protein